MLDIMPPVPAGVAILFRESREPAAGAHIHRTAVAAAVDGHHHHGRVRPRCQMAGGKLMKIGAGVAILRS